MNVLLIEDTLSVYSKAPQEFSKCAIVCFQDSFIMVMKGTSYPFRVENDPIPGYNFPDNDVTKGLRQMIDSCTSEDELKGKLNDLVQNNTLCVVNFSDYKKVKVSGFLGSKTLKVSNNLMNYISFSTRKQPAKDLASFYSNL